MPGDSRAARANAFHRVLNTKLRPLGAGELLDRAVTLFVQRFVPIVIVIAVTIVPLFVLQALVAPQSAHVLTDMGKILSSTSSAGGGSSEAIADLAQINASMVPAFGVSLVALLLRILMWSAIVYVIATVYTTGVVPTVRDAYTVGINCWPAQVLVGLAFAVIGGICFFPLMIVYFLIFIIVLGLSAIKVSGVIVALVAIVLFLALLAAFAVVGSFVYMTYELAAVYVVTESPNAIEAISAAIRRNASRDMIWRTIVAGLVVVAITQGGLLPLILLGALVTAMTHIDAAYFAIFGTGTILLDGLVAAFLVVYAMDVRVRREGLDLFPLAPPEAAQPAPG
jgi:hypothetical protein